MTSIVWDPQALKNFKTLMDPKKGLPTFRRELLTARIDALRKWPPSKWFDLRNQKDGRITFRLDSDQFASVLGVFEDGVVKITHVEVKTKGGN